MLKEISATAIDVPTIGNLQQDAETQNAWVSVLVQVLDDFNRQNGTAITSDHLINLHTSQTEKLPDGTTWQHVSFLIAQIFQNVQLKTATNGEDSPADNSENTQVRLLLTPKEQIELCLLHTMQCVHQVIERESAERIPRITVPQINERVPEARAYPNFWLRLLQQCTCDELVEFVSEGKSQSNRVQRANQMRNLVIISNQKLKSAILWDHFRGTTGSDMSKVVAKKERDGLLREFITFCQQKVMNIPLFPDLDPEKIVDKLDIDDLNCSWLMLFHPSALAEYFTEDLSERDRIRAFTLLQKKTGMNSHSLSEDLCMEIQSLEAHLTGTRTAQKTLEDIFRTMQICRPPGNTIYLDDVDYENDDCSWLCDLDLKEVTEYFMTSLSRRKRRTVFLKLSEKLPEDHDLSAEYLSDWMEHNIDDVSRVQKLLQAFCVSIYPESEDESDTQE